MELVLKMRTDNAFLEKLLKNIDVDQQRLILDIFMTGFMLASVNAFGKMKKSSYLDLVYEQRISPLDRLKILIAYMKSVADD